MELMILLMGFSSVIHMRELQVPLLLIFKDSKLA